MFIQRSISKRVNQSEENIEKVKYNKKVNQISTKLNVYNFIYRRKLILRERRCMGGIYRGYETDKGWEVVKNISPLSIHRISFFVYCTYSFWGPSQNEFPSVSAVGREYDMTRNVMKMTLYPVFNSILHYFGVLAFMIKSNSNSVLMISKSIFPPLVYGNIRLVHV